MIFNKFGIRVFVILVGVETRLMSFASLCDFLDYFFWCTCGYILRVFGYLFGNLIDLLILVFENGSLL